jgi:hypothetical protein
MDDRTRRWLLRELGGVADDPAEALEAAIASGDLVVVEHPRAVYWRGQHIGVNWEKRPALWDFFHALCWQAKAGQAIDHMTFNAADIGIVAKQKSRLRGLQGFPRGLAVLIRPTGRFTQRLNLPPSQIRFFEVIVGETVRERTL